MPLIDLIIYLGLFILAITVTFHFAYWMGYGDAVREHLDNLRRQESKNWYKCMEKHREVMKNVSN